MIRKILGGLLAVFGVLMLILSDMDISSIVMGVVFCGMGLLVFKSSDPEFRAKLNKNADIAKMTKKSGPLQVNPEKRTWKIGLAGPEHHFEDLHQYELIEIGDSESTIHMKGGVSIGRAIVGTALAGLPGMVLGGLTGKKTGSSSTKSYVNKLYINVSAAGKTKNINLLNKKTYKKNMAYSRALKKGYEIISLLDYIQANQ